MDDEDEEDVEEDDGEDEDMGEDDEEDMEDDDDDEDDDDEEDDVEEAEEEPQEKVKVANTSKGRIANVPSASTKPKQKAEPKDDGDAYVFGAHFR